jgi:hypothetical protein
MALGFHFGVLRLGRRLLEGGLRMLEVEVRAARIEPHDDLPGFHDVANVGRGIDDRTGYQRRDLGGFVGDEASSATKLPVARTLVAISRSTTAAVSTAMTALSAVTGRAESASAAARPPQDAAPMATAATMSVAR